MCLCSPKCSENRLHPVLFLILLSRASFSCSKRAGPHLRQEGRGRARGKRQRDRDSFGDRKSRCIYWERRPWGYWVAKGWTGAEMVICWTKFLLFLPLYRFIAEKQLLRQNWVLFPSLWNSFPSLLCQWKGQVTSSCQWWVRSGKNDFRLSRLSSTCPFSPPLPSLLVGKRAPKPSAGVLDTFYAMSPLGKKACWSLLKPTDPCSE